MTGLTNGTMNRGVNKQLLVGVLLLTLLLGQVGCGCECVMVTTVATGVLIPLMQMARDAEQARCREREFQQLRERWPQPNRWNEQRPWVRP